MERSVLQGQSGINLKKKWTEHLERIWEYAESLMMINLNLQKVEEWIQIMIYSVKYVALLLYNHHITVMYLT